MGLPYVTGPALCYAGLPANVVQVLPVLVPPAQEVELPPAVPGAFVPPPPAANPFPGPQIANPNQPLQDAILVAFQQVRPVFFGTTEDTPMVDFDPAYVPLYTPETGSSHPSDRLLDGEEGTIVLDLTSYNEFVYFLCAALGSTGVLNRLAPRGTMAEGHTGTLAVREGMAIPLWLVFPYAQKPLFGLNGMPGGYRFFACVLTSHSLGPLNTKPRKVRLVWRAVRQSVRGTAITGLYDHDMRGLPFPF